MVLQEIELKDEIELEFLLKQDLEQIERGLKVITNQLKTSDGRIDILAVDSDKNLVVIELKQYSDDNQMSQAIGYFDWVFKNIDWIRDAYKKEIKDAPPRIILVAREFSEKVILPAKYWDISQVSLYSYKTVKVGDKKEIICYEVPIPTPPEITEKPKEVKDFIEYIIDENVRDVVRQFIEKIQNLDLENIEVVAKKWGIVFKYKQRNFGTIYPRRESFLVEYRSQDDEESKWPTEPSISNSERADIVLESKIKPALEFIKRKVK